jgi:hypothetical protein
MARIEYWVSAVLLLIGAAVWFYKPLSDVYCNRTTIYWACDGKKCVTSTEEFTVHPEQQLVILNVPDGSIEPMRLQDCTIVDRLNWSCAVLANKPYALSMKNGDLTRDENKLLSPVPTAHIVSRWEWWGLAEGSDTADTRTRVTPSGSAEAYRAAAAAVEKATGKPCDYACKVMIADRAQEARSNPVAQPAPDLASQIQSQLREERDHKAKAEERNARCEALEESRERELRAANPEAPLPARTPGDCDSL